MKSSEFFVISDYLAELKESNEITFRTIINRSYYACYHEILKVAKSNLGFITNSNMSTHKQLSNVLINNPNEEISNVGIMLQSLHRSRVKADYKLEEEITKNIATLCSAQSKLLISSLKEQV